MSDTSLIARTHNGVTIQQRQADGYLDATAMCRAYGKQWGHYWSNGGTKEFAAALAETIGIPIVSLIESREGRNGGTWVHRHVAIHLAQWLDELFAVQVTQWVDELLTTGRVELRPSDDHPWMERLNPPVIAFRAEITRVAGPGHWSVATAMLNDALVLGFILSELGLPTSTRDLPDGSAGKWWSNFREGEPWTRPRRQDIALELPKWTQKGESWLVNPWIYHPDELPHFMIGLHGIYLPEYLPQYLGRKLPAAEYGITPLVAADEACLRLVGRNAVLPASARRQIEGGGTA